MTGDIEAIALISSSSKHGSAPEGGQEGSWDVIASDRWIPFLLDFLSPDLENKVTLLVWSL